MPRLSFCLMTKNSARFLEPLLRSSRSFADEVVVAVDSRSTDGTEELCSRYADKLFRVESPGTIEATLPWLNEQCTGDWIFRLDDDELPSAGFIESLPRLLADRAVTHYRLRRRWVVGDDRARYIVSRPWWPDWQLRLFRNLPSLVSMPCRLHTSYKVQGGGRFLTVGSIYHTVLVDFDEAERKKKVERYEALSPGRSGANYFLPDLASLETAPFPADDPPPDHSAPADGPPRSRIPTRSIPLLDVQRVAMQEFEVRPELFRAILTPVDCPTAMAAGRWHGVDLVLRNESYVPWPFAGLGVPEIKVGYHWLKAGALVEPDEGHRTELPHTLHIGEETRIFAGILPPSVPGDYALVWDLWAEGAGWFTRHGWTGPARDVQVIAPVKV